MSWFRSLRDDFTLRPFELQQTHSDNAAMASAPPDVMANQEPAEAVEECSGKKKSKFQTFKKFFARKKRKEPPAAGADAALKGSQSSDNVSKTSENNTLTRSEKDKGSGSKISLGSKALSHDSVFVSDSSEANEALGASQDSIHGKVKSLQMQLKQAIRLGSPPSLMCVKKTEDAGTMSEDDGLPCSPPEYTTLPTVMNQTQRNSSISLEGIDSDDDQLSYATSSRAVSPLVVPGDFSQPASPFGCLDNSAAKHKLGLRHKACNKRKPVGRLEVKAERDSVGEEMVNTSITEALEEGEQKTSEVSGDEQKPKVEREEEDDEEKEEEEEAEQPQHSRRSLLRDREEGEDESDGEQDASRSPDASSPELCLSEEETPDAQPLPSSKSSSRASSLDSPRAMPEPPADQREDLLDPPGIAYGAKEDRAESDLALRGEADGVQGNMEEESSFLEEVLSSLKTPLASCSLGAETEGVVLEIEEEEKEKEREDLVIEKGAEVEEEEAEVDEPIGYQAAPAGSLSDQTTEEEEEVSTLSTPPCQVVEEEEKVGDKEEEETAEEEEEEEEEEELVVEHFSQHCQEEEGEKEEAEEVKLEEQNDVLTGNTVNQAEEERRGGGGEESEEEEEEEPTDLEKDPQVEEEEVGREKREDSDEEMQVEAKEAKERVEEAEEAIEEERDDAEETVKEFPDSGDEEVKSSTAAQEVGGGEGEGEDEGEGEGEGEDDTVRTPQYTNDGEVSTETGDQASATVHQSQSFGEEGLEEGAEIDPMERTSEQEEDDEEDQPEPHPQLEGVGTSHLDTRQVEEDRTEETVSSKPSSLSLPESRHETPSQESGSPSSPSKTSTTTVHINLISPSSERVTSFFQQSPTATSPEDSEAPSLAVAATEEEEPADGVETREEEEEEEEKLVKEAPASAEETVDRPSSRSDQSKVLFTITPAWQRSLSVEDTKESVTPPSSPAPCSSSSSTAVAGPGGVELEAATKKDPDVSAEPAGSAKVELVLSPGRVRSSGTNAAKPHSNEAPPPSAVKPQASAAASTEAEGNPSSPFGVRLRKTSHRFSLEEENPEPTMETPPQPTSSRVDSPQPISVKPAINQPASSKPALPRKPDVHADSGGKNKRVSEPAAAARGVSGGSESPSWISVAKQKQRIYKENSLDEITVKKEEPERKSSLPMYVSSAASKESTGKVSPLEISKPSASAEKEVGRALSPPAPVPSHPPKSQSLPCPVPPKPQVPPATAKHLPQRSLSPPTPVPVPQKSPSCTSPPALCKTVTSPKAAHPQTTTLTSPPFSSRTAPEKPGSKTPGLSSQSPSSQRGLPPPALPQDEPPWMALAKKKAKAWSEMPQIVQ
ncbi:capping protein-inhibiting regulator of actin dynamics [Pempheris klunzingeri]|uniref:capping protein-inhibiting regulator of actin dynamics n=1 Tax=Pempheris klunzingeri TaxID=3127111 RepID=UPI0039813CAA